MSNLDPKSFLRKKEEPLAEAAMPAMNTPAYIYDAPESAPTTTHKVWKVAKTVRTDRSKTAEDWYNDPQLRCVELEARYKLPMKILKYIIQNESHGNPDAISNAGALGLFGIIPQGSITAEDARDPARSAELCAKFLARLLKMYKNDIKKAIVAYNWGEGHFAKVGKDFKRAPGGSRTYANKVKAGVDKEYATMRDKAVPATIRRELAKIGKEKLAMRDRITSTLK